MTRLNNVVKRSSKGYWFYNCCKCRLECPNALGMRKKSRNDNFAINVNNRGEPNPKMEAVLLILRRLMMNPVNTKVCIRISDLILVAVRIKDKIKLYSDTREKGFVKSSFGRYYLELNKTEVDRIYRKSLVCKYKGDIFTVKKKR